MKKITLRGNHGFVKIDNEDFKSLNQWKWYLGTDGYAYRNEYIRGSGRKHQKRYIISIHRLLLNPKKGKEVDHINKDRLDNRRKNLRIVTSQQNNFNRNTQINNKSGYQGVCWYKPLQKWRAYINKNRKQKHLGYFNSLEEAANSYRLAKIIEHNL